MLSERPLKSADQKTERGKVLNPEYSIDRDQSTSWASPLRINTLLYRVRQKLVSFANQPPKMPNELVVVFRWLTWVQIHQYSSTTFHGQPIVGVSELHFNVKLDQSWLFNINIQILDPLKRTNFWVERWSPGFRRKFKNVVFNFD